MIDTVKFEGPFLHHSFGTRGILSFNMGIILSLIYSKGRKRIVIVPVVGVALYAIGFLIAKNVGLKPSTSLLPLAMVIWPTLICIVLLIKPIGVIFSSKPMHFISSISTEIYMIHFPVQIAIGVIFSLVGAELPYDRWWFACVYIVSVFLVAMLVSRIRAKVKLKVPK